VYFGEKLVSTVPGLEEIVPGVKYHHEKANGTGYPYHLSNTDTPVMARIIIVANAYDNLFTNNSGNQSPSELLKEFAQKEREFDPESLKAILVCHRNGVLSQIAQTTTV
jgi:HD-GYP domain-containing protein (c-di-GMP phosphodiesterase class II)